MNKSLMQNILKKLRHEIDTTVTVLSSFCLPSLHAVMEREEKFQPIPVPVKEPTESFVLTFPFYERPIVSIIILVWNKIEYTQQCLRSVYKHADVPYEVIIVNNASTDSTQDCLSHIQNAVIIINKKNVGFSNGCNQGAQKARGQYLLFLNNDTVVTFQWLSRMTELLELDKNCGAVGPRMLSFDGTLLEAGFTFTHGGFGRGDNPKKACYLLIREVDFCAGACLMVRTDVFMSVGGFDETYVMIYYEDCDLCLKIRERGYRILYQPAAIVYHNENTSNTKSTISLLMETNKKIFEKRWKSTIENRITHYGSYDIVQIEREKRLISSIQPFVSIIVLASDRSLALQKSLNAVLSQSYPYFEIILVNNSADANIQSIINNYEEKYPNIRCCSGPKENDTNRARNRSIREARSEIVAVINCNVIIPQKWMQSTIPTLLAQKNNSDIVGSNRDGYYIAKKTALIQNLMNK